MTFPSSSGTVRHTLEDAWAGLRATASLMKSQAQATLTLAQGAGVDGNALSRFCSFLADNLAFMDSYGATPGLVGYAQAQINNPAFDVTAAFNSMTAAVTNTGAWITTNFPHDASGNLLFAQFTAAGRLQYTTFTPAQLAGLITQLQALIASID